MQIHVPDRHAGPEIPAFKTSSDFRDFASAQAGRSLLENDSDAKCLLSWVQTPLGVMIVAATRADLLMLEFAERRLLPRQLARIDARFSLGLGCNGPAEQIKADLASYFAGTLKEFETPLAPVGTPFEQSVWRNLRLIEYGKSITYADLAAKMGRPSAVRSVARANGANPIAIAIPCHRVLASNGALCGYGGGLWRKERLRAMELPIP